MYFARSFIASALVGLGAATTHSASGMAASQTMAMGASETMGMGAASSPSAAAGEGMVATHVIQVGGPNGSLTFSPDNIKANVGDLVQFQFHPKNHSVVQSTFDQPCVPMQNVMPNATNAFFSGFMPTNASAAAASGILTYTIRVMDSKPVWFYCSQAKHCQSGMVGAINAAASGNKTVAAFKALAAQASANLSPGQGSSGAGSASPTGGAGSGSGSGSGSGGSATTGAGGAGGAGAEATASSSASGSPAQQTVNAAPGLDVSSSQSLFGLTVGVFAAFFML